MADAALPIQPWMIHPGTRAVMGALARAGGADCARFVGGCVRNAVLGVPVRDIDIATTLTPPEVLSALKAAGLKAIPTGIEHGTITAVAKGEAFEITTLRRDVATDGRRAVVAFTTDWGEDAARRDFRLNALYADAEGRLFDPTGAGLADARAGAIVFVGDAATRIREDALRILRYFRFLAWYGRGEPDAAALAACEAGRDLIAGLSAERIGHELLRLLEAPGPLRAVRLMAGAGVLRLAVPAVGGLEVFEALLSIQNEIGSGADPLLRLASLLPADPAIGVASAGRLRLSGAERDRLALALGTRPALTPGMSARESRRIAYALGGATSRDRILLAWARSPDTAGAEAWRNALAVARDWPRPSLPVSGGDVIAAGVAPGPGIGDILREVETWWIDQDFIDDKAAVLDRLKGVIAGRFA